MRTPKTYDELKSRISQRYGELSGRLQQIAEFALDHPNDMALGTVATIAGRAGVQPSSIVRFATALGFGGFSDMQRLFRSRLVAGSPSYRERIESLRELRGNGAAPDGKPPAVLAQFVSDGIGALEHLQQSVPEETLLRAAALLAEAQTIYCLAQGRAFPVAYYLNYAFTRLDQRACLLDGIGGMTREQARQIGRADALVAISFKEYSKEVAAIAAECSGRGVRTVAITDGPLSPIARRAEAAFEIAGDWDQPFRSLVAPICLAQTLVVALGHHLAARDRRT